MSAARTALTVAAFLVGPVIAGLVMFAASQLYSDRLLAGFVYASCGILLVLFCAGGWLLDSLAKRDGAQAAQIERTRDQAFLICALVSLAYAALPWLLAASAIILLLVRAMERAGDVKETELQKWRTAAEFAGIGAFLAFQAAALLFAPTSVQVGLDWAARLLLWSAAALALASGGQYVAALLKRN